MKRTLIYLLLSLLSVCLYAQQESRDVRKGNKQYEQEKYVEAEIDYRRGLEKNNEAFEAQFNLGNTLFKQEKYEPALEAFQKAHQLAQLEDNDAQMAACKHNMGNALYAMQQYDKAATAYKESLKHNPKDNETRYNYVKAMQMLQEQQQQQQNQEQKQDKQEQQEQQQQQQQQQEQQQDEQQMDKETAEQLLQALEQDEKETQEKVQEKQSNKGRSLEKDW